MDYNKNCIIITLQNSLRQASVNIEDCDVLTSVTLTIQTVIALYTIYVQ